MYITKCGVSIFETLSDIKTKDIVSLHRALSPSRSLLCPVTSSSLDESTILFWGVGWRSGTDAGPCQAQALPLARPPVLSLQLFRFLNRNCIHLNNPLFSLPPVPGARSLPFVPGDLLILVILCKWNPRLFVQYLEYLSMALKFPGAVFSPLTPQPLVLNGRVFFRKTPVSGGVLLLPWLSHPRS